MTVHEFHYRASEPALGHFPGHHRSRRGEAGFELRGHASLLDAPDPRRLDLHASLRDPFGQWRVRVYSQRMAVPVLLVADLSASMSHAGRVRRLDVLADFTESLAASAWRTGDSFGFVGCDETARRDWFQPPTRMRGAGERIAARLRGWQPAGRSARGLLDAHRHLPRQRALVFLVSDFHLPLADVETVLKRLAPHEVVPVVLWDPAEFAPAAERGLLPLVDAESGERRLVWWRPALRERWEARRRERHAALVALCRRYRHEPLLLDGGFDADRVTRHFHR